VQPDTGSKANAGLSARFQEPPSASQALASLKDDPEITPGCIPLLQLIAENPPKYLQQKTRPLPVSWKEGEDQAMLLAQILMFPEASDSDKYSHLIKRISGLTPTPLRVKVARVLAIPYEAQLRNLLVKEALELYNSRYNKEVTPAQTVLPSYRVDMLSQVLLPRVDTPLSDPTLCANLLQLSASDFRSLVLESRVKVGLSMLAALEDHPLLLRFLNLKCRAGLAVIAGFQNPQPRGHSLKHWHAISLNKLYRVLTATRPIITAMGVWSGIRGLLEAAPSKQTDTPDEAHHNHIEIHPKAWAAIFREAVLSEPHRALERAASLDKSPGRLQDEPLPAYLERIFYVALIGAYRPQPNNPGTYPALLTQLDSKPDRYFSKLFDQIVTKTFDNVVRGPYAPAAGEQNHGRRCFESLPISLYETWLSPPLFRVFRGLLRDGNSPSKLASDLGVEASNISKLQTELRIRIPVLRVVLSPRSEPSLTGLSAVLPAIPGATQAEINQPILGTLMSDLLNTLIAEPLEMWQTFDACDSSPEPLPNESPQDFATRIASAAIAGKYINQEYPPVIRYHMKGPNGIDGPMRDRVLFSINSIIARGFVEAREKQLTRSETMKSIRARIPRELLKRWLFRPGEKEIATGVISGTGLGSKNPSPDKAGTQKKLKAKIITRFPAMAKVLSDSLGSWRRGEALRRGRKS
jgi:hypothetical protein